MTIELPEIFEELQIADDDYYRALSISKDDGLQLHVKRKLNSCFVSNYFDNGLKVWQANIFIQPVFKEYEAVAYMCSYVSKIEDQCSQAMKNVAKEQFKNNLHHQGTVKTISQAYVNKLECSVQEAVENTPQELRRQSLTGILID